MRLLTESLAHVIAEQTNSSLQTIKQRLQLAASRIAPLSRGEPHRAALEQGTRLFYAPPARPLTGG